MPRALILLCLLLSISSPTYANTVDTGNESLDRIFSSILKGTASEKKDALSALQNSELEDPKRMLNGILNGTLRVHKKSKKLVFVEAESKRFQMIDAFSGEKLEIVKKRKLKKFGINNKIRSHIRAELATMNLRSDNPELRMAAVKSSLEKPTASSVATITSLVDSEPDADIKTQMQLTINFSKLSAETPAMRIAAIGDVSHSLSPTIRNKLNVLATSDPSDEVRIVANKAVAQQAERVKFYGYLETAFFGASLGSVLLLAAIGLAITFGVMGVINMAHGELIMLGAYTTYLLQQAMPSNIGLALVLSIPAAFMVSGLVGIAIERGVIRFLYGRPLETLLATFGISLILQQLVRTVISPQNVPVENPSWMSGFIEINSAFSLTYNRLVIIGFSLAVFALLFYVLKKTRLGLEVRAVSQNRAMARSMGIRSARVDAMTFGLGSGIAGVAGVALSQLTNVGPNLGQAYIIDSFMVVVFGGVGNLWGTLISAFSLGITNKILEPWAGAVLAKILVLIFIILFIQKRPRGLFPQKGRAAEN